MLTVVILFWKDAVYRVALSFFFSLRVSLCVRRMRRKRAEKVPLFRPLLWIYTPATPIPTSVRPDRLATSTHQVSHTTTQRHNTNQPHPHFPRRREKEKKLKQENERNGDTRVYTTLSA